MSFTYGGHRRVSHCSAPSCIRCLHLTTVMRPQGDAGDYFWVVSTGSYQVSKNVIESTENMTFDDEGSPLRPRRQSMEIQDSATAAVEPPKRRARESHYCMLSNAETKKSVVLSMIQAPASFGDSPLPSFATLGSITQTRRMISTHASLLSYHLLKISSPQA